MGKVLKIIAGIFSALILLVIVGVILLITLVNPNNFKSEISDYVKQETGRDLVINGDLSWSFFPWVGINVNDLSLSNAPGFGVKPMAEIGQAAISVKLMPLFSRSIEIGTITLTNMTLNLISDEKGTTNWDDLNGEEREIRKQQRQTETPPQAETEKSDGPTFAFTISKVNINNANIFWENRQTGQEINLTNFKLNSTNIQLEDPFPISLSFDFKDTEAGFSTNVALGAEATINPKDEIFELRDFTLTSVVNSNGSTKEYVLSGDFVANMPENTIKVDNFSITAANLQVNGEVSGSRASTKDPFQFTGQLKVSPFNLKALLKDFGHTLSTNQADAFTKVSLEFSFSADDQLIKVNKLYANLDGMDINGNANIRYNHSPEVKFSLAMGKLNLDRYLPLDYRAPKASKKTQASTSRKSTARVAKQRSSLLITGNVSIKHLSIKDIDAYNVNAPIRLKDDVLTISPLTAGVYGGSIRNNITIDSRGKVPSFKLNYNMSNVQINKLLQDLTGKQRMTGSLDMSANLTMSGSSTDSLMRSLNGSTSFKVRNGALLGVDIDSMLETAFSLAKKLTIPSSPRGSGKTEFSEISGSADIRKGVATTNNLLLRSRTVRVTGKGSINLVTQAINMRVLALALVSVRGIDNILIPQSNKIEVPIQITGTLNNPKYTPDVGALAKIFIEGAVKRTIEGQILRGIGGGDGDGGPGKAIEKIFDFRGIFP